MSLIKIFKVGQIPSLKKLAYIRETGHF